MPRAIIRALADVLVLFIRNLSSFATPVEEG
jgi:hypothetical protein